MIRGLITLSFTTMIFLAALTTTTHAVDVAFDGYFRTRGHLNYNLDLDRDQSPALRAFQDFRFRLDPTFFVTDQIRIRTSLNFLDGQLGGSPYRVGAYTNPAATTHPELDPNGNEGTIGRSTDPRSVYGGVYYPDGLVSSSALEPIQLRRAWAEIDIPYGTMKVGRMPHDFGLGIFANAGDRPDQENGNSRDRVMFDTSFGPYYAQPGVSWIVEGALDSADDDFIEYFFVFGRKTETQNLAFYFSYSVQDKYIPDTSVGTTELNNAKTSYFALDFFAQHRFNSLLEVGSEIVLFTGKAVGFDLLAVNAVARANLTGNRWKASFEGGVSTGTSDAEIAAGDLKGVAFNRDYDVALVVFEEALPGGRQGGNPTAPRSGAVSNAVYGKVSLGYDVISWFQPMLQVIVPFALRQSMGAGGKMYGIEYDLLTLWPLDEHWAFHLDFGHFFPMNFYDSVAAPHMAFVTRGGVVAKF